MPLIGCLNIVYFRMEYFIRDKYEKKKCPKTGCNYSTIEEVKFHEHMENHTKKTESGGHDRQHLEKLRTCVWCDFCSIEIHVTKKLS